MRISFQQLTRLHESTLFGVLRGNSNRVHMFDINRRLKTMADIPGPPQPPTYSLIWNNFLAERKGRPYGKNFCERQIKGVENYGKIFKQYGAGTTLVQIADPDASRYILQNETKYPIRTESKVVQYYRDTRKAVPGVFFGNGPHWYKHRSVIRKKILRPRQVAEYSPTFNEISNDFLARLTTLRGPSGSEHENEVQDLDFELFKWAFEGAGFVLFDRRLGGLDEHCRDEVAQFIKSTEGFLINIVPTGFLPVWFYKIYKTKTFKNFTHNLDSMYYYANLFIEETLEDLEHGTGKLEIKNGKDMSREERTDFFSFLLASGKLGKEDLLASVIDLLFAGGDTTSNTMQWVLYMMGKNPEKQAKLHREVTSILSPGEQPTVNHISKMPYLRAWIKETLRLYPVVPFLSRQTPGDMNILGYHLPAGTDVSILVYCMGRDDDNFDHPLQFRPERWLRDESNHTAETIHGFASMSFGFGTRMCIGRRIAELELHLLTAKIVQQFLITYPHEEHVQPFMRAILIPDRPMRVRFLDRLDK